VNQQAYHAVDHPEGFEFARPGPFGAPILAPLTTGQAAGTEEGAGSPEGMDAAQFARAIRRLAVDAHRALRRPDASDDKLLELRGRSEVLLRAAGGARQGAIRCWLQSAQRTLDAARRPQVSRIDQSAAVPERPLQTG
jgi:hypothetical protein